MAQQVKNAPAMQETQEKWVWSLGHEDLLEKEMTTQSNILAWKTPWKEEPGRLQYGVAKSRTWQNDFSHYITICQYSYHRAFRMWIHVKQETMHGLIYAKCIARHRTLKKMKSLSVCLTAESAKPLYLGNKI